MVLTKPKLQPLIINPKWNLIILLNVKEKIKKKEANQILRDKGRIVRLHFIALLVSRAKPRHLSQLAPTTPQNKLNTPALLSTDKLSLRRSSEAESVISQNIFSRRFSKAGLSRQDSIFTRVSEVNITSDPNTGKSQVNQFILAKPIGKGSFAEVFLGYDIIK